MHRHAHRGCFFLGGEQVANAAEMKELDDALVYGHYSPPINAGVPIILVYSYRLQL